MKSRKDLNREYEKLRKREQRKKIYENKTRHVAFKQQCKTWRANRKAKGVIKLIADLNETQQEEQRRIWRQQHNYYRHGIPIPKRRAEKKIEMKFVERVCKITSVKNNFPRCKDAIGKLKYFVCKIICEGIGYLKLGFMTASYLGTRMLKVFTYSRAAALHGGE